MWRIFAIKLISDIQAKIIGIFVFRLMSWLLNIFCLVFDTIEFFREPVKYSEWTSASY